jgi:nucleotide-binding universal stress UspA family protein
MGASGFGKIMAAVDGSRYSLEVVSLAVRLVRMSEAGLLLLHVRDRVPEFIGAPYYQHMLDQIMARTETLLRPCRELLAGEGIVYEERILEGNPASAICEAASRERCDLIVMGSHGFSDLEGLFMGSVSHKVLVCAPCPVLVVR